MIRGRTIALRPMRESDLEAFLALDNDLERKGAFVPPRLRAEPVLRKEFQETGLLGDDAGRLLIVDGEDRILGNVGYFRTAFYIDGFELGYTLYEIDRRGGGLVTEAVGLLASWLFALKKIARLQIAFLPENGASRRVAEKNGFRLEGVLRKAAFNHGRNVDIELWSLLREEWEEKKGDAP
jgi:ribosomal-protein-alanine N-acetyltransferase